MIVYGGTMGKVLSTHTFSLTASNLGPQGMLSDVVKVDIDANTVETMSVPVPAE